MSNVLAALDNSAAAASVVATARNLAEVFGSEVEAVHVGDERADTAVAAAAAAGLELRRLDGPVVPTLARAVEDKSAAALVVGTRGLPGRPVGSTALEVITSLTRPVVVVPPEASLRALLRRVLVPLEGTLATSLAPKALIELADDAELELVVLHVHEPTTLPAFTDQPQHEADAWRQEFLARYCPWGIGKVDMRVCVGSREEEILRVAAATEADLVAIGWAQQLAAGRAPVVRELLKRGRMPVLLLPLRLARNNGRQRRRTQWNSLQSLRA